MLKNLLEMNKEEHEEWLRQQGVEALDLSSPCEENLCRLVSHTLRIEDKETQAQAFVDIANMALALADKALGSQNLVAQCIVLQQH